MKINMAEEGGLGILEDVEMRDNKQNTNKDEEERTQVGEMRDEKASKDDLFYLCYIWNIERLNYGLTPC